MARRTDAQILFDKVPKDGSTIGNSSLIKKLNWNWDKYWKVRNSLIFDNKLSTGKGKGGSVYRSDYSPKVKTNNILKEDDLYKPFEQILDSFFSEDLLIKQKIVKITANAGSKDTGGRWTRPDLVLISVNTYQFIQGKIMDTITFELKTEKDFTVVGVFEAAAHSRFATKSYYCAHLPEGWKPDNESYLRIKAECERFGVGLLVFSDVKNYQTYETLVDPSRKSPDPHDLDNFISRTFSEKEKKSIIEMLH